MKLIKAILAGVFISLAGIASATAITGNIDVGIGKIIAGLVFSAGLLCTFMMSATLFTGEIAVSGKDWLDGKMFSIPFTTYIKRLCLAYFGNLIGAIIVLSIVPSLHPDVLNTLANIGTSKVNVAEDAYCLWFVKGVFCNLLVATGVMLAKELAKTTTALVVTISVPVSLFIICGFEHSIANMFLLPASYIAGADISVINIIYCILFVTIGNLTGGLFVAYYFHKVS